MPFSHAFAGNPLIPGKQDHLSSEALVRVLQEAEENGSGAKVLPLFEGRPLVSAVKEIDNRITWHLAWQSLEDVGMPSPSELSSILDNEIRVSSRNSSFDKLIYLGEKMRTPYFALGEEGLLTEGSLAEKTGRSQLKSVSKRFKSPLNGGSTGFVDLRTIMMATDWQSEESKGDLAVAGHARALLEWHKQAQHCGKCGAHTIPVEAGNRRQCSTATCAYKAYPRIDPVVIMMVIDRERDSALLGRQARFLPRMWSCLAGFIEPGESLEEAVRRETKEEVGLEVGEVVYHSSQPWPVGFGNMSCQLMIGFYAYVKTTNITVDKKELDDARWHSREELHQALSPDEYSANQSAALNKIYATCHDGDEDPAWAPPDDGKPKLPMYVPGPYAIAHHLIHDWVNGGPRALQSKV